MNRTAFLLASLMLVFGAVPARAQNFLQNSAETINQGNFKIAGFPTIIFGEDGADNEFGLATRFGYGFTDSFDVEGKVAFFDNVTLWGADAEFWIVKGRADVSIAGGLHKASVDNGFDSTAIDTSLLVSSQVAHNLDLYGGLSLSFESLDDVDDSDFTRAYIVPGVEYKLSRQVDLVGEIGIGLNDDSPNYLSFGIAWYLR
jgi:Outer membrane protein beta-barrel domain